MRSILLVFLCGIAAQKDELVAEDSPPVEFRCAEVTEASECENRFEKVDSETAIMCHWNVVSKICAPVYQCSDYSKEYLCNYSPIKWKIPKPVSNGQCIWKENACGDLSSCEDVKNPARCEAAHVERADGWAMCYFDKIDGLCRQVSECKHLAGHKCNKKQAANVNGDDQCPENAASKCKWIQTSTGHSCECISDCSSYLAKRQCIFAKNPNPDAKGRCWWKNGACSELSSCADLKEKGHCEMYSSYIRTNDGWTFCYWEPEAWDSEANSYGICKEASSCRDIKRYTRCTRMYAPDKPHVKCIYDYSADMCLSPESCADVDISKCATTKCPQDETRSCSVSDNMECVCVAPEEL